MLDSKSLDDLHPTVRAMAVRLLASAKASGIPLTVTCTLRSLATQAARYAQGRTAPGPIVTNARPGYSYHNYGLALDVVTTELLGLPGWGDAPGTRKHADVLWAKVGAIGKALGFRWGGEFAQLKDRPHFEWSGGLTLAQLRAGLRPGVAAGQASAPVPVHPTPPPVHKFNQEGARP